MAAISGRSHCSVRFANGDSLNQSHQAGKTASKNLLTPSTFVIAADIASPFNFGWPNAGNAPFPNQGD